MNRLHFSLFVDVGALRCMVAYHNWISVDIQEQRLDDILQFTTAVELMRRSTSPQLKAIRKF